MPANSAVAITHWQARGHAQMCHALNTLYPSAAGFWFDSDDVDTHFECSVVNVAGLRLLRTVTSGYQCHRCPGPPMR